MNTELTTIAAQAEDCLRQLAEHVALLTDHPDYAVTRLAVNVNGKIEWESYSPSSAWQQADTFAGCINGLTTKEARIAKLRERAAALLTEAEGLSK